MKVHIYFQNLLCLLFISAKMYSKTQCQRLKKKKINYTPALRLGRRGCHVEIFVEIPRVVIFGLGPTRKHEIVGRQRRLSWQLMDILSVID